MKYDDPIIGEMAKLEEVFKVLDTEKLLKIARKLREVMEQKHGEVILTVKNGKLAFIDKRESEDVR
ncbi:MAG: hypothetical protein ACYC3H_01330 [Bellilinea sp.]